MRTDKERGISDTGRIKVIGMAEKSQGYIHSNWLCFFLQAEDGIRGLVQSRGLGDVYR